jgi:twinkle protein
VAPYYDVNGALQWQKVRSANKEFVVYGDSTNALPFGWPQQRGGGKMLVITEGEIDALTVSEAMGGSWPVISVPNGAQSAYASLARVVDALEGYEKVVLAFDKDEAGQSATEKVCSLLTPGKVYIADFGGANDPSDLVVHGPGYKALRDVIWGAKPWRPDGIVNLAELKSRIKTRPVMGTPYPWPLLNKKLYGHRGGELVTWCAGTGIGKTAIVSEVLYDAAINSGKTVGVMYLEESLDRAGKRLVGIHMDLPIHLPDVAYTDVQFDEAFDATLGTNRLYAYEHFGSVDSEVLMARLRYMVKACECDVIALDHISIAVSGNELATDERRTLDRLVTQIRSLTQETMVDTHIVSHLKRTGGVKAHEEGGQVTLADLRGTQAIAQLSDVVIAAERNQQAEDELDKNTTLLRILKNRYTGETGLADQLSYSIETGRLSLRSPHIPATTIPNEDF